MPLDTDNNIMAIGRNRSGMYSGELDYTIYSSQFEKLEDKEVGEVARLLESLTTKCYDKMFMSGIKTPLWYRMRRWADLRHFPMFKEEYRNWPISFAWCKTFKVVSPPYISTHGWQIGWKDYNRIYGWTLHIGRLKIKFGKQGKI